MEESESPRVILFGDNHIHPRAKVKERLISAIPEHVEVVGIEHPGKSPHETDASRRIYWNNPSLYIFGSVMEIITVPFRLVSNRIVKPSSESVFKEVADELGLNTEYTDIPMRMRFENQPSWLTSISWFALLTPIVLFLLEVILTLLQGQFASRNWVEIAFRTAGLWVILIGIVSLISAKVYSDMREAQMAEDCLRWTSSYNGIVFCVGDSHVKGLLKRLEDKVDIGLVPESRPPGYLRVLLNMD